MLAIAFLFASATLEIHADARFLHRVEVCLSEGIQKPVDCWWWTWRFGLAEGNDHGRAFLCRVEAILLLTILHVITEHHRRSRMSSNGLLPVVLSLDAFHYSTETCPEKLVTAVRVIFPASIVVGDILR